MSRKCRNFSIGWICPGMPAGMTLTQAMRAGAANVRKQLNAPDFGDFFFGDPMKIRDGLLAAACQG